MIYKQHENNITSIAEISFSVKEISTYPKCARLRISARKYTGPATPSAGYGNKKVAINSNHQGNGVSITPKRVTTVAINPLLKKACIYENVDSQRNSVAKEKILARKKCSIYKKKEEYISTIIPKYEAKVNASLSQFFLYTKICIPTNTGLIPILPTRHTLYEYRIYHHSRKPKNRIRQPAPQTNPKRG
jgi:hypothetical protein